MSTSIKLYFSVIIIIAVLVSEIFIPYQLYIDIIQDIVLLLASVGVAITSSKKSQYKDPLNAGNLELEELTQENKILKSTINTLEISLDKLIQTNHKA